VGRDQRLGQNALHAGHIACFAETWQLHVVHLILFDRDSSCEFPGWLTLMVEPPLRAGHVLVALARRHGKSHEANEALFLKR
jgi:hypothetical protein